MARLRKRGYRIKPRGKKIDPLKVVFKSVMGQLPDFKKSQVERQTRGKGITVKGSWPVRGRQIYDWELDFEKEADQDVVVKINLWGAKGTNYGETYRVSIARLDKVAEKIAIWIHRNIAEIKQKER